MSQGPCIFKGAKGFPRIRSVHRLTCQDVASYDSMRPCITEVTEARKRNGSKPPASRQWGHKEKKSSVPLSAAMSVPGGNIPPNSVCGFFST